MRTYRALGKKREGHGKFCTFPVSSAGKAGSSRETLEQKIVWQLVLLSAFIFWNWKSSFYPALHEVWEVLSQLLLLCIAEVCRASGVPVAWIQGSPASQPPSQPCQSGACGGRGGRIIPVRLEHKVHLMQSVSSELPFTLLQLILFIIIIDRRKVQPSCWAQRSEGSRRVKRFVPLSKPAIVLSLAHALYFTCLFWASCCCSHYSCWQVAFLATWNHCLWLETLWVQYEEGTDCWIFKNKLFHLKHENALCSSYTSLLGDSDWPSHALFLCSEGTMLTVGQKPSLSFAEHMKAHFRRMPYCTAEV